MPDRSSRSIRSGNGTHRRRRNRDQADNGASEASRTSSARPPAHYSDDTPRQQTNQPSEGYAPSVRSTASRFSLNQQFASTRREIEFDFDDASSIARSTIRSQPIDELVGEDSATEDEPTIPRLDNFDSYYDILCVSRDPSADSIRRAYTRLFPLFYPEIQPPHLQQAAQVYFTALQNAFETLFDPCRRLKYDLDCLHGKSSDANLNYDQRYAQYCQWHAEVLRNHEHQATVERGLDFWELGARLDAQEVSNRLKHGFQDGTATIEPVDFEMGHSFSIHLPGLDRQFRQATRICQEYLPTKLTAQQTATEKPSNNLELQEQQTSYTRDGTVLAIKGSVYGFLQNVSFLPVITLLDPYQPSFSTTLTKDRLAQLHVGKIHPSIAIKLRHNVSQNNFQPAHSMLESSTKTSDSDQFDTIVEAETEVLPDPSVSVGISKCVMVPYDKNVRSMVQVGVKSALFDRRFPRFWSSLRRPTAGGMLLCSIDSGDWQMRADETCRVLSDFTARIKRKLLYFDLPLYRTPKLEIAYKVGGSFDSREILTTDRLSDRGLRGLDKGNDIDEKASWTISTAAEPSYLSASLKFARDVGVQSPQYEQNSSVKHFDTSNERWNFFGGRDVRVEAELSANSLWAGYFGLRCLKRVGRFSKLGFELGLSSYSLHLSVYWSRLGRRINLPFLMCSRENLNMGVLFWTTLVPFTGFAAWEAWSRYQHLRQCRLREKKAKSTLHEDQGYKRFEADQVAAFMTTGVQSRQRTEYTAGGLVILSAKYGVKAHDTSNAWGAEEVADVTMPVAALVDSGRLCVPAGVCKSNLLGFWDPSPGEVKVLHIRYKYKGKEATVEVSGDDEELVLPPSPSPVSRTS